MTDATVVQATPETLRRLNQEFPDRYPFLLQSTARGDTLGRFDILFADPGESLVLERIGDSRTPFLDRLDREWRRDRIDSAASSLPFLGGWFLYLGYELAGEIEPTLKVHDDSLLPAAFAVRCRSALIIDHRDSSVSIVAEDDQSHFADRLLADIDSLGTSQLTALDCQASIDEESPQRFVDAVNVAKECIAAGEIYQANLSREWRARVLGRLCAESIYESLCRANPGPFAGIARWQGTSIVSSSPERLLRVRSGEVSTRPIAGTRPRDRDASRDDDLSAELFANPKERAEHVMLIDLERNDLGRVCQPGSVEVDEMMVLESYAHVHHIVSNVRGRLQRGVTPGQIIAAVFPGGTITGCPKVRCMEIISELEAAPRGAYTGSFGYLNLDGSMDLNILIRTIVKQGDSISLRAGAGIVADSEANAELMETRAKARGMLQAIRHE